MKHSKPFQSFFGMDQDQEVMPRTEPQVNDYCKEIETLWYDSLNLFNQLLLTPTTSPNHVSDLRIHMCYSHHLMKRLIYKNKNQHKVAPYFRHFQLINRTFTRVMDQMFLTENHPIRNYFGKGILGKRRKAKQFIIEPISLILREFLVQFTGKSLSSCSISFMDPSTFLKSLYSDLNKKKDTAVFNINYLLKLNLFSFQPNHDLILYLYKRLNQLTILLKFLKDECIKCYSRIRQALLRNTYFVPFAVMSLSLVARIYFVCIELNKLVSRTVNTFRQYSNKHESNKVQNDLMVPNDSPIVEKEEIKDFSEIKTEMIQEAKTFEVPDFFKYMKKSHTPITKSPNSSETDKVALADVRIKTSKKRKSTEVTDEIDDIFGFF